MVWVLAGLWALTLIVTFIALSIHERRITNLETTVIYLMRRAHQEDANLKRFLSLRPTPGKA